MKFICFTLIRLLLLLVSGGYLYLLFVRLTALRPGRFSRLTVFLLMTGSSGMVIWVGDNNLLFTLPVFFALCYACTTGNRLGRLVVIAMFFCLLMSLSALADTYFERHAAPRLEDLVPSVLRAAVWGVVWIVGRRRLPEEPPALPGRLWGLLLGLMVAPFCSLLSVVLLSSQHESEAIRQMSLVLGITVLPFVFLSSLSLLVAITVLSRHEALERGSQMAAMREVYYEGLQRQQTQVRQLRHDLRNHLAVVRGLVEQGDGERAMGYLDQIAGSPALRGAKRLCENEAANVVLTSKAEAMRREGLEGDFSVTLPKDLPVADIDLCALLGNALDNAMEGARRAEEKRVTVRCRADRGLFMLRVENAVAGPLRQEDGTFRTTKANQAAHGFGLTGMREIAERYGGSLDVRTAENHFELVACLPLT